LIWRVAAILGAVFALLIIAQDVDWLASAAGLTQHGTYGFGIAPVTDQPAPVGEVNSVDAGGPAARAGLKIGDRVRLIADDAGGDTPLPGAKMVLDMQGGAAWPRVVLVADPTRAMANQSQPFGFAAATLADAIAAALGLLILLRGRARPEAVLVGVALGAFGMSLGQAGPVFTHEPLRTIIDLADAIDPFVQYSSFLAFGLVVLDAADGGRRWRWPLFWTYAAVLALIQLGIAVNRYGFNFMSSTPGVVWRGFVFIQTRRLASIMMMLSLAGTAGCLAMAWARSLGQERRRVALINLAFGAIIANQAWIVVIGIRYTYLFYEHLGDWHMLVADALAGVVAPALFAYAILRHRVIDLGFAVNRTLVYSIVSAILLLAFGLIEWAVDHFVKIEGREQNALIDAAIALGVFLTFHRVTGFVEHGVEALFFRQWQAKEAALREAVAEAAFITKSPALLTASVTALSRFAEGRACALYLKAGDGFARAAGAGPDSIDADDPALVRLRATRKPAEPALAGSSLDLALACPMIHRGEVIGAAVFAQRPDREPFRPDEVELLGWAVQQLGQDLHALRVEALETEAAALRADLSAAQRLLTARPGGATA
jgi:hypothetical protein